MKNIYNAPNKEVAAAELDNLEKKWGGKYPYAILSWRNKWDDLTVFFQFPLEIRKIIYTTNLIENLNGKIRMEHLEGEAVVKLRREKSYPIIKELELSLIHI